MRRIYCVRTYSADSLACAYRYHTELYVILSGQGVVKIGDLPATAMKTFDVTIIPPGTRQSITNIGNFDLIFLALCTPGFKPECYQDIEVSTGGRC